MGEYTEQEIEMLARFWWDLLGGANPSDAGIKWAISEITPLLANERRGAVAERMLLRAAARLMREAREQGLATARDEIRKACEREQATWDQLHRDVKAAREQGAAEMLDKALAVTRKIAALALASVKKRDAAKPYSLADAHDEGAYVQAETIVLALEELAPTGGPSEYERGAAEMRERAARLVKEQRDSFYVSDVAENIMALPLTAPA